MCYEVPGDYTKSHSSMGGHVCLSSTVRKDKHLGTVSREQQGTAPSGFSRKESRNEKGAARHVGDFQNLKELMT